MTPARPIRPVLTGRALLLAAMAVALVVVLASPISHYLATRSDLQQSATTLQHDHSRLTRLTQANARFSDPGYIQAQARTRLQYAMPGDTVLAVIDRGRRSAIERSSGPTADVAARGGTWNQRLWNSLRAADQ